MPKVEKTRSASRSKKRISRSDSGPATAKSSSPAEILAKSGNDRLVKYADDTYRVHNFKDDLIQDLMDDDDIPPFSDGNHQKCLRSVGYNNVTDLQALTHGSKNSKTLLIFRLQGEADIRWLTKSTFLGALQNKSERDLFTEALGALLNPEAPTSNGSDAGGSLYSSNHTTIQDRIKNESDTNRHDENAALEDVGRYSGNQNESNTASGPGSRAESEAEGNTESEDQNDGDASDRRTPSPRGKILGLERRALNLKGKKSSLDSKASSPKSTMPVASAKKTRLAIPKTGEEKIIYARKFGKKWQAVIQKDIIGGGTLYDMEELKTAPDGACTHCKETSGFAPTVDKGFILGYTRGKQLDRKIYKLVGCTGFRRGKNTTWRAAILELTNKELKQQLNTTRVKEGCTYTGPLLCSWTQFTANVRGDKDLADELFSETKLGKELEDEGIQPRSVRHQTLDPDAFRLVHDKIDQLSEQVGRLTSAISRLELRH